MNHDGQARRDRSIDINIEQLTVGVTIVHLLDDLTGDAAAGIQQNIIDQLARTPSRLTVNLSAIISMPGGIGALAFAATIAGEADGTDLGQTTVATRTCSSSQDRLDVLLSLCRVDAAIRFGWHSASQHQRKGRNDGLVHLRNSCR